MSSSEEEQNKSQEESENEEEENSERSSSNSQGSDSEEEDSEQRSESESKNETEEQSEDDDEEGNEEEQEMSDDIKDEASKQSKKFEVNNLKLANEINFDLGVMSKDLIKDKSFITCDYIPRTKTDTLLLIRDINKDLDKLFNSLDKNIKTFDRTNNCDVSKMSKHSKKSVPVQTDKYSSKSIKNIIPDQNNSKEADDDNYNNIKGEQSDLSNKYNTSNRNNHHGYESKRFHNDYELSDNNLRSSRNSNLPNKKFFSDKETSTNTLNYNTYTGTRHFNKNTPSTFQKTNTKYKPSNVFLNNANSSNQNFVTMDDVYKNSPNYDEGAPMIYKGNSYNTNKGTGVYKGNSKLIKGYQDESEGFRNNLNTLKANNNKQFERNRPRNINEAMDILLDKNY